MATARLLRGQISGWPEVRYLRVVREEDAAMGVRAIGLQSLLTVPVADNRPKTRAEVRSEELRGVSPLEFAERGMGERPLRGTSALNIQLSPTDSGSLGGGLYGMAEAIVRAQANVKISIVGIEPLSELLRVGRR